MDNIEPNFKYSSCRFKQDKFKLNAARVVVWNELKVTQSFCLETSQYGYTEAAKAQVGPDVSIVGEEIRSHENEENRRVLPFTEEALGGLGKSLLLSIVKYIEFERDLEKEYINTGGWLKPNKMLQMTGKEEKPAEYKEYKDKRVPKTSMQPPPKKL